MSTVRTIYRCDMCQRQYGATSTDPSPKSLGVVVGGSCVRSLAGPGGKGRGEACDLCIRRLKALVGAAWDALKVEGEEPSS